MKYGRYSLARRLVSLSILGLFFLQILHLKGLVGSLSGSLVYQWIRLIDLFAFAESSISSQTLSGEIFYPVAPILILYLILGRAFCGWVCPLDLIFQGVSRLKKSLPPSPSPSRAEGGVGVPVWKDYLVLAGFLALAAWIHIPFFSVYFSPITNFYRSLYTGFWGAAGFPGEITVFEISFLFLGGFLLLEYLRPRLWCKKLCPVGKTYGLFNYLSLLHLQFSARECTACQSCREVCYQEVEILSPPIRKRIRDSSCILCGRCVEACDRKGKALRLRLEI